MHAVVADLEGCNAAGRALARFQVDLLSTSRRQRLSADPLIVLYMKVVLAAVVGLLLVGLFGFLNRWNDSMATDLEDIPLGLAARAYADRWESGKHAG